MTTASASDEKQGTRSGPNHDWSPLIISGNDITLKVKGHLCIVYAVEYPKNGDPRYLRLTCPEIDLEIISYGSGNDATEEAIDLITYNWGMFHEPGLGFGPTLAATKAKYEAMFEEVPR